MAYAKRAPSLLEQLEGRRLLSGDGLKAEYFNNPDLTSGAFTRVDPAIDFNWDVGAPDRSMEPDTFSVRWSGQIEPEFSEKYTFSTTSDDGARLWVNGQLIVDNWWDHPAQDSTGSIELVAGQKYDVRMEYYENGGYASSQLCWESPSQLKQIIPSARLYSGSTV